MWTRAGGAALSSVSAPPPPRIIDTSRHTNQGHISDSFSLSAQSFLILGGLRPAWPHPGQPGLVRPAPSGSGLEQSQSCSSGFYTSTVSLAEQYFVLESCLIFNIPETKNSHKNNVECEINNTFDLVYNHKIKII